MLLAFRLSASLESIARVVDMRSWQKMFRIAATRFIACMPDNFRQIPMNQFENMTIDATVFSVKPDLWVTVWKA